MEHFSVTYYFYLEQLGIPMHRYVCEGEIGENLRRFTLLFHPEDGIWLLVLSD